MFWGVCWPDLSDAGSSAERTQESTYKREPGPVCSCTCSVNVVISHPQVLI